MGILCEMFKKNLPEPSDIAGRIRGTGDEPVRLSMRNFSHNEIDVLVVALAKSLLNNKPNLVSDEEGVEPLCQSAM